MKIDNHRTNSKTLSEYTKSLSIVNIRWCGGGPSVLIANFQLLKKIKALLQPKTAENDQWRGHKAELTVTTTKETPTPSQSYYTFVVVLIPMVVSMVAIYRRRFVDKKHDEELDEESIPLTDGTSCHNL